MSFETFRKLFKHIHKLSSKDTFLAQTTKANIRAHFDIYKKTKKQMKLIKYKQKDGELLDAFERFIEQTIIQNAQISQKAKMKLIEICFGLNQFVDENFQLKKDFKSAQIKHLQSYEQFINLQTDKQRDFVKKMVKKVIKDYETYPYRNLTDFFKDFRSQTSKIRVKDITQIKDKSARQHISKIIQNTIYISPDYRILYNLYFSIEEPFNLALQDYINSRYVMVDFDDFSYPPTRNQKQLEKQAQLRRKLNQKRLENIKMSMIGKEVTKTNQGKKKKIQQQVQKEQIETKNYTIPNQPKLQFSKKQKDQQRKLGKQNSEGQKLEKISENSAVNKKEILSKEQKQIDRTSSTKKSPLFGKKQQKVKIDNQINSSNKIKKDEQKQQIIQNQKIDSNKKSTKGFLKKK